MAFEDLKEQLREQASEALAKIQETSAFNSLRERYESQTPPVQKAITLAGIGLFILFLSSCPMSYISSSSETLAQFEENRELIQGLLRASRSAKEPPPLPPPMSSDSLKGTIDGVLRQAGLLPDQIGEMNAIPDGELKGLAPAGVLTAGLAVQIKKLNLQQVIELGNLVQNMAPGTKLLGLDVVQSAGTSHYYDMILRVINFGLPAFDTGTDESGSGGSKRPPPRKKPSDADAE
jgi:hypothetical protein